MMGGVGNPGGGCSIGIGGYGLAAVNPGGGCMGLVDMVIFVKMSIS